MIAPMAKVRITGLRSEMQRVTELLHDAGVLHLEAPPPDTLPLLKRLTPGPNAQKEMQEIEKDLARLRGIDFFLETVSGEGERTEIPPDRIGSWVNEVIHRFGYWAAKKEKGEQELLLLQKYEKILLAFSPMLPYLQESPWLEYLGFTLPSAEASLLESLRRLITEMTGGRYELLCRSGTPDTLVCLLIYPRTYDPEIRKLLWDEGLPEIRLPASYSDRPFVHALRMILERKDILPLGIAHAERRLMFLARKYAGPVRAIRRFLENRLEELRAEASFYGTSGTFWVYGWVPVNRLGMLRDQLRTVPVLMAEELSYPFSSMDDVPVSLKNPGILKSFEWLTRLLPLPRYGSTDPTPWIALFFPLFFGVMLGDVGYGSLLGAGSLWVRSRWAALPLIRDLATVFAVASAVAAGFGIVFGECFGAELPGIGLVAWIDRKASLILLLYLAVGVGLGHLGIGLFLGLATHLRRREIRETAGKIGKLLLLVSGGLLALSFLGIIAGPWTIAGWAGVVLSLCLMVFRNGWLTPLEVTHLFSHLLSYVRLMGFGAASVYLAFLANDLGARVEPAIAGIGVALFFHGLNLLLSLYAPAIQALRLHYVEFYHQFYLAGGKPYQPFRRGNGVPGTAYSGR